MAIVRKKRKWALAVLLVAMAGFAILSVSLSRLEQTGDGSRGFGHVDTLECIRPQFAPDGVALHALQDAHIPSVRNIIDPNAPNYTTPTNARWGVLGAFPGDTTVIVEQGQFLVAARLLGKRDEAIRVQWGEHEYPVIAVYGGGVGWKQRYITMHNGKHYMLPIQWNEQAATWEPYHLDRWFAYAGPTVPRTEDSLEGRCADCHTVSDMSRSGMVFIGLQ